MKLERGWNIASVISLIGNACPDRYLFGRITRVRYDISAQYELISPTNIWDAKELISRATVY